MRENLFQWIRRGLWVLIALFFAASGGAIYVTWIQLRPSAGSPCDDCLIEPLRIILNFGAPLATGTISGLACLTYRVAGRLWPVAFVGVLSAATIAGLVTFSVQVFRNFLPGHDLARIIWWF